MCSQQRSKLETGSFDALWSLTNHASLEQRYHLVIWWRPVLFVLSLPWESTRRRCLVSGKKENLSRKCSTCSARGRLWVSRVRWSRSTPPHRWRLNTRCSNRETLHSYFRSSDWSFLFIQSLRANVYFNKLKYHPLYGVPLGAESGKHPAFGNMT